jgi:hypothetical protein
MLRTALTAAALAAATTVSVMPTAAEAQPGGTVAIRFARGATCWVYSGSAWRFSGRFFGGQTLRFRIGRAAGEARFVSVGGDDVYSGGTYDIPYTGRYVVTIWPRALHGARGTLQICTRG